MTAMARDAFSHRLPSRVEIANADGLRQIMASLVDEEEGITLEILEAKGKSRPVTLTPAIAQTFLEVLRLISSGRGFRLIPVSAQLTTQEAADLLNVSRPFLIKRLEAGDIPHTKIGRHRRIEAKDLFAYKDRRDQERADALADMAALDMREGMI
ncbi:MAG: helix-turn-helix domain-containing protein [Zavarzinia sp.]|nr:helix-turn-helix domain-containing protein [Zavarzinia sp.]